MKILHLDSSFDAEGSASRQLSQRVVHQLIQADPAAQVNARDLVASPIAHLTAGIAAGFRAVAGATAAEGADGPAVDATTAAERQRSEQLVTEFLASDVIVIGVPMYNFSVPSQLKAWLDRIAQPGRTFRYTAQGPVGLAGGRRVILASTRGGSYAAGPAAGMDFQESYLRAFFGFLGISDVQVVRAERLTKGAEARAQSLAEAAATVPAIVANVLAA